LGYLTAKILKKKNLRRWTERRFSYVVVWRILMVTPIRRFMRDKVML
jgi:hypothetical protein